MPNSIVSNAPARAAAVMLALCLSGESVLAQSPPSIAAVQPQAQKGTTTGRAHEQGAGATDKLDNLVRRAADIFKRVPCSNKGAFLEGSLPGIARKLAANQPVTIVALGSSSTAGYGATSPVFTYPYRLADQLRRKFPRSDITVLNRGIGGEEVPEMVARLQTAVLDARPDLVIWQLGTNMVIKSDEAAIVRTEAMISDAIDRIKLAGADVVLIDPQYVPATAGKETEGKTSKMVDLLGRVAQVKQVARFPRFAVMKTWHKDQKLPFDTFVIHDGLHLNDWGYACFAQLLGDTIIDSVARVQAGTAVPPDVLLYRPL